MQYRPQSFIMPASLLNIATETVDEMTTRQQEFGLKNCRNIDRE